MIEIRIQGRAGQGVITASELLAIAAFENGNYSQAFPQFSVERRGAPIEAYCRIDSKPINLRTHVYKPEYLIVTDHGIIDKVDVYNGLNEKGIVVVNSPHEIKSKFKTVDFDANALAMEIFKSPIVNTIMLGVFCAVTNLIKVNHLTKALEHKFQGELLEKNRKAVEKAYEIAKKKLLGVI